MRTACASPSPSALALATALVASLACGGGGQRGPYDTIDGPGGIRLDTGAHARPKPEPVPDRTGAGCPDGVAQTASWPGEWPGPVVYLKAPVELPGRTTPCAPEPDLKCLVPAGLYHPWARSDLDYQTVLAVERWKALAPIQLEETPIAAGTIVEIQQYQGEGYCEYVVGGQRFSDECPALRNGDVPVLEQVGQPVDFPAREVFEVSCGNGGKAWIEASDAIFAVPGVERGEFTEWGEVGPPGSGGWE